MTSKERAAMQQACQTPLKDLLRSVPKDGRDCYEEDSTCHHFISYGRLIHEALAEIERLEALAEQAEQSQLADASLEPVATYAGRSTKHGEMFSLNKEIPAGTKLYAAPVRTKDPCHPWQDLTDDEIANIFSNYASDLYKARAVIAADRAKNNLCERTK